MSGNWGIKADDGYVNFIHGTIDKVCDFETSSSIDDVCIFSEMVAKGYAQALNATAFRINISEQSQLTIPKSIADELKEAIGVTNFESTPYSIKVDEDGYLMMWASLRNKKLSEKTYKFCRDNTRVFDAYLNPLTRDLVKVVEG